MHVDTIRAAIRAVPFVPFVLRLNDGREFVVNHPDYIAVANRHVYYVDPGTDAGVFLEPVLIASLEIKDRPSSEQSEPQNGEKR